MLQHLHRRCPRAARGTGGAGVGTAALSLSARVALPVRTALADRHGGQSLHVAGATVASV
jgi:hypothetical protein